MGTQDYCMCKRTNRKERKVGSCSQSKLSINFDYDSDYCMELPAVAPVLMGSFNGMRVCGTRSGTPFKDVTRLNESGKCPDGTKPCSTKTSPENTLCYPSDELSSSCPITGLDIVSQTEAA